MASPANTHSRGASPPCRQIPNAAAKATTRATVRWAGMSSRCGGSAARFGVIV